MDEITELRRELVHLEKRLRAAYEQLINLARSASQVVRVGADSSPRTSSG